MAKLAVYLTCSSLGQTWIQFGARARSEHKPRAMFTLGFSRRVWSSWWSCWKFWSLCVEDIQSQRNVTASTCHVTSSFRFGDAGLLWSAEETDRRKVCASFPKEFLPFFPSVLFQPGKSELSQSIFSQVHFIYTGDIYTVMMMDFRAVV